MDDDFVQDKRKNLVDDQILEFLTYVALAKR